jgi:uncharacterized membrane protein
MLPQIPSWDGLHPLIIHFPIALLLVVPILIVMGLLMPNKSRAILITAFVVMLLGTIATYVAVSTGEAAGELADRVSGVEQVLEQHEDLAETTRTIFTALTAIFAAILFAPSLFKKTLSHRITVAVVSAFLLFYLAGSVVLINTAHNGGRLVHEFGVRAIMSGNNGNNAPPQTNVETRKGDDDDDK